MRPRRAVLQILPKSFVPRRLPLYNSRHPLTPSESTLLQVLIPQHFNSSRMNTYEKPGEGAPLSSLKVLQLVTTRKSPLCPHTNAHKPNIIIHLRTPSVTARGGGAPFVFHQPWGVPDLPGHPRSRHTVPYLILTGGMIGCRGRRAAFFPLAYRGEFMYFGLGNRGELPTP